MRAQIEVLLSAWGRWAIRRDSKALGFPRVSPMFRDAPLGDSFGNALPLDLAEVDLLAVDASIMRLPPVWREAVIQAYQRGAGKSMDENARQLGIDRKTLGKYISKAHEWIAIDMRNQFPQNTPEFDRVSNCVRKPASA